MSSIGHIIKVARISQKIKQAELANGICTPSYLSRIENSEVTPKNEMVNLLLNRLNLSVKNLTFEEEDNLISSVTSLYKQAVPTRDKELIRASLDTISNPYLNFNEIKHYYTYHMYRARLFMMIRNKSEDISDYYTIFNYIDESKLDLKQSFLFNLLLGLFNNTLGKAYDSVTRLENSLNLIDHLSLEDWEIADLHNAISVVYMENQNYYKSVTYASKALKYFQDHLLFERTIESFIFVGVAQKRLLEYTNAEKSFTLAQELADNVNLSNYVGIIHHNFGSLYALQGKHTKAIKSYESCLKNESENNATQNSLPTIFSIIIEYAKENNAIQVVRWCEKGFALLETKDLIKNERLKQSYYHHFMIYYTRFSCIQDFEKTLVEAIKYFEKTDDDPHVQKYSIMLGNHYFQQNKYKAASLYYQKANDILLKQKSIRTVDDL